MHSIGVFEAEGGGRGKALLKSKRRAKWQGSHSLIVTLRHTQNTANGAPTTTHSGLGSSSRTAFHFPSTNAELYLFHATLQEDMYTVLLFYLYCKRVGVERSLDFSSLDRLTRSKRQLLTGSSSLAWLSTWFDYCLGALGGQDKSS